MPRRLGQHFLVRTSTLQRIAELALPEPSAIIEIGAGRGALTQHLLPRCQRLIAIELDQVLVHYLQEKFRGDDRFQVVHDDILKADLGQWGPVTVAGNLPYYITSPILERVLALGPALHNAVFLVQKEVAERITAVPGTRAYGYLSVLCQIATEAKYIQTVPPEAFRPPPKVDSAVVHLLPRTRPLVENAAEFLRFAGWCFAQKRKTLRNNLLAYFPPDRIERQPEARLRAEQLPVEQLADLHTRLTAGE